MTKIVRRIQITLIAALLLFCMSSHPNVKAATLSALLGSPDHVVGSYNNPVVIATGKAVNDPTCEKWQGVNTTTGGSVYWCANGLEKQVHAGTYIALMLLGGPDYDEFLVKSVDHSTRVAVIRFVFEWVAKPVPGQVR